MALFKISKGQSKNLPQTYNEGYAYFTTDDGKFYIDTSDSADGRIGLNAFESDKDRLGNIIDETYITTADGTVIDGPAPLLNADTLNGKTADDFVLKSDNINVGDAESLGGLPASDYVTFDDIDQLLNNKADKTEVPDPYTLPMASATVLGGVKVGNGLSIDANGVLSLNITNASGVSF